MQNGSRKTKTRWHINVSLLLYGGKASEHNGIYFPEDVSTTPGEGKFSIHISSDRSIQSC